ncbi:MAG: hypothetical protein EXR39_12780 [Betaproteobacteria bacterium]|nr:hypothetical protein [Betaproteobacteria bacterium]
MRTPDAIMLATAIEAGATLAVTNDAAWRKVYGIEILLLRDLNKLKVPALNPASATPRTIRR